MAKLSPENSLGEGYFYGQKDHCEMVWELALA